VTQSESGSIPPGNTSYDIDEQLPENGVGFANNNRAAHGEFQFRLQSSIATTVKLAGDWNNLDRDRTEGVVEAFQGAHGLAPDGIAGAKTLAALGI
jgi:peptidoglycan hydrolase-like protein with peptidoglycan-binding domain